MPETHIRVLIDCWYVNKCIWKAVKARQWDLMGDLKKNYKLRMVEAEGQLIWMGIADYAAELSKKPSAPSYGGGETFYAHLIRTKIKKLDAYQVLIVKTAADAPGD